MMIDVPGWCMHWGCMYRWNARVGDIFPREMWCLGRHSKGWGLQTGKFTKLARRRATIYNT